MKKSIFVIAFISLLLASCSEQKTTTVPTVVEPLLPTTFSYDSVNDSEFSMISPTNGRFSVENEIYTISSSGTYILSGKLDAGCIKIAIPKDEEVEIELNNCFISSNEFSPIFCVSANKVKIKSIKGTINYIKDNRKLDDLKTNEDKYFEDAAIYSVADLKFSGKGTLNIESTYNCGICTKKDFSIKNTNLNISSVGCCIKGYESIEIQSGNILCISSVDCGLKTKINRVSAQRNQKGNISILGGQVDIYSYDDGIKAERDFIIENSVDDDSGETLIPILNVFTGNYSKHSLMNYDNDGKLYITHDDFGERDVFLLIEIDGKICWKRCNLFDVFKVNESENQSETIIARVVNLEDSVEAFKIYVFDKDADPNVDKCLLCTEDFFIRNNNFNCYSIVTHNNKIVGGNWCNYDSKNIDLKGDKFCSSRGINVNHNIKISKSKISISSFNDSIYAKGSIRDGSGNISISDSILRLISKDDAIHCSNKISLVSSDVNISECHEGIEGNFIIVDGGKLYIVAYDDGINGTKLDNKAANVLIVDGIVDITVDPEGVADAIDSNGSYEQSGGVVILKGPNSKGNSTLDVSKDCNAIVKGGSLICFGKPSAKIILENKVNKKVNENLVFDGEKTIIIDKKEYEINFYNWEYRGSYIYTDSFISFST